MLRRGDSQVCYSHVSGRAGLVGQLEEYREKETQVEETVGEAGELHSIYHG